MAARDSSYNLGDLTVVIIDDHDPIRKAIKRVLVNMGFGEIVECFDGEDALKLIAKKPIDIVICDLYMRQIGGFDVIEHLRNRDIAADTPILVVTGEASKEEIVKVADMGADDYLLKPFQAQDLEKKIGRILTNFFAPSALLKAMRKAERLYLAEDFERALKAFDEALVLDAQSPRAVHGKALTLGRLDRAEQATQLLENNLRANHSYHKHYGTLADIYLKQGRLPDATEAMRRELEINPKQPNRQIHLATLLMKEGNALGAVDHFRIALQEDPKRLTALMGMGQAYAQTNNLDKALYYFKRVRRYHPSATKALEAAVRCAWSAGEPRKAELLLKDEKMAHPERSDTYLLLAMLQQKQEREDEVMATLDELLARDPENTHALRMKGAILLKRRDFEPALAALQLVAKIAPSAEVLAALGETLLALGKLPEAIAALNKAISLNADNPYAFLLLADAHKRSQQWLKASFLYRKAAQLGSDKNRCMAEARTCSQQVGLRRARIRAPRAAS